MTSVSYVGRATPLADDNFIDSREKFTLAAADTFARTSNRRFSISARWCTRERNWRKRNGLECTRVWHHCATFAESLPRRGATPPERVRRRDREEMGWLMTRSRRLCIMRIAFAGYRTISAECFECRWHKCRRRFPDNRSLTCLYRSIERVWAAYRCAVNVVPRVLTFCNRINIRGVISPIRRRAVRCERKKREGKKKNTIR